MLFCYSSGLTIYGVANKGVAKKSLKSFDYLFSGIINNLLIVPDLFLFISCVWTTQIWILAMGLNLAIFRPTLEQGILNELLLRHGDIWNNARW